MPTEISINYTGKKKEAERIDRENALMIGRLMRQTSSINNKEFAKEYNQHLQFIKRTKAAKSNSSKAEAFIEKRKQMMRNTVGSLTLPKISNRQRANNVSTNDTNEELNLP